MVDKEKAKNQIRELVEKYRKLADTRNLSRYDGEENTKKDFIERLFLALGWNVYNSPNFENSSDVTAEEKVSKGRVDYGFRINGIPKFFLEAKALTENLDDPRFARQAIDYSYLKSCTWAVLTNFETVKILNAEWKETDPIQSHFMTIKCQEFMDKFEDLWLLSEEGFEQGLLDRAAERYGKKSKKSPVGEQLLADFTEWRARLSKNISSRPSNQSKHLSGVELDEAVQRIIDRLIFIRNCEDRGLEERKLLPTMREWKDKQKGMLVERIRTIFNGFINDYDSELFAESLCDQLEISNEVLEEIINGLHNTKDKIITYDFSAIPADVLGSVYEQYLSHILKKTEKRATLTEKVAHRKEQGIYYTPTHIVDYIVKGTLGELLKEKKIDAERIRVLDLACGSGSFLIKAFDALHDFYTRTGKGEIQAKLDVESALPFSTKVQVLSNNIFGVDLDKQAVEITRLNLLLKVAERKRILPTLNENIKCGNSLVDDDAFAGDRAFKWKEEFEKIMDEGGFDVVVGNPPYINMQLLPDLQNYCEKRYPEIYTGQNDILYYFLLRGLEMLKESGKLGFITSRYFLESSFASKFRRFIVNHSKIDTIIDFNNYQVFGKEVNVLTSIIILQKEEDEGARERNVAKVIKVKNWDKNGLELMNRILQREDEEIYSDEFIDVFEVKQTDLTEKSWSLSNPEINSILKKIEKDSQKLGDICDVGQGMTTGLNEAFVVDAETALNERIEKEVLRNYVKTRDLKRYVTLSRGLKIIYTPEGMNENKVQNALAHLDRWRPQLKERFGQRTGHREWYCWDVLRNRELFERGNGKIITPLYSTSNKFIYDSGDADQNYYTLTDTYIIVPRKQCKVSLKYVLAVLNSKLIEFYFKNTAKLKREGYYEYSSGSLSKIPIRYDKNLEGRLILLVDRMLSLKKRLVDLGDKKTDERVRIENEVGKTDTEIDELAYKIYGITEEEKRIIEGAVSRD